MCQGGIPKNRHTPDCRWSLKDHRILHPGAANDGCREVDTPVKICHSSCKILFVCWSCGGHGRPRKIEMGVCETALASLLSPPLSVSTYFDSAKFDSAFPFHVTQGGSGRTAADHFTRGRRPLFRIFRLSLHRLFGPGGLARNPLETNCRSGCVCVCALAGLRRLKKQRDLTGR